MKAAISDILDLIAHAKYWDITSNFVTLSSLSSNQ